MFYKKYVNYYWRLINMNRFTILIIIIKLNNVNNLPLPGIRKKTEVIKSELNPTWDEVCDFYFILPLMSVAILPVIL